MMRDKHGGVVSALAKLRIVYGEHLDGATWPPMPEDRALGGAVVGPAGLLALVETLAGLAGPPMPAARRIATMRQRLAALSDRPRFWSASFQVDPWAVAREILNWRDSLVEAGWTAGTIADPPPRLADLAALEALVEPTLPVGFPDRLVAATDAVRAGIELPFEEIRVVDQQAELGPGMRRLLDAVAAGGIRISYAAEVGGVCKQQTDLGRVQAWLSSGQRDQLTVDGSFTVLRGHSEATEAEALADWLAAQPDDGGTVFVLGAPTEMLDGALARRGLPRFGHLLPSPLRGGIQVLSLAFATRWRPLDPAPLLDLLSLPQSPIPGGVAGALASALTEAPGREGPLWIKALEKGLARRREGFEHEGLTGNDLERRIQRDVERWSPWLKGELFDEMPGMPAVVAREICGRVTAWSDRVASGSQSPVAAAGAFATTLSQVVLEAGIDPLPRVQLERMIDAVVADGVAAEHVGAEAAPWSHVRQPGQVWGDADTVVWWGFGAASVGRPTEIWTAEEAAALRAGGCLPDDSAAILARESAGWRRAVLNARERVVLVVPPGADGEEGAHPLLHELAPLLADCPDGIHVDAESVLARESTQFGGRTIMRRRAAAIGLPQPRPVWSVPPGTIKPRPVEAATSIELLLGCPFAWTLRYSAKVRPSQRRELPEGEQLLGLLAHALAAEIFKPGPPPTPAKARRLAEERLPGLIEEMASPLRLPGRPPTTPAPSYDCRRPWKCSPVDFLRSTPRLSVPKASAGFLMLWRPE